MPADVLYLPPLTLICGLPPPDTVAVRVPVKPCNGGGAAVDQHTE